MWLLRLARGHLRVASNTFTLHRWATNPFQLYSLLLLLQVSLQQLLIGAPPDETPTAQGALDYRAQIALAICNLVGTVICAIGLHLRDTETGLWIELSGYIALIGSVGIYLGLAFALFPWPNTSFGLALAQAFILASVHRAVQIVQYKHARRRRTLLEADLLRRRLDQDHL